MIVTRDNFAEFSKDFLETLDKAIAVSMDLEMSGINSDEKESSTDTPMERYLKSHKTSAKYQIIQFGISVVFPSINDSNQYQSKSYTIYVIPRTFGSKMRHHPFQVEMSAIEFLNEHDTIDYNLWLKKGVQYFNKQQQQIVKDTIMNNSIEQMMKKENFIEPVFGSFNQEWCYKENQAKMAQFLKDTQNGLQQVLFLQINSQQIIQLVLQSFVELTENNTQKFFISLEYLEKKKYLKIQAMEDKEYEDYYKEYQTRREDEYNETAMFNIFWDKMVNKIEEKQIKLVGHNFFQDLMFIMSHFNQRLPSDYQEFKESVRKTFSNIYDTKLLAKLSLQDHLNLEELYSSLQSNSDFISVKEQNGLCLKAHDASYDAYMTAVVFMNQLSHKEMPLYRNVIKMYNNAYYGINFNALDVECVTKTNCFVVDLQGLTKSCNNSEDHNLIVDQQKQKINKILSQYQKWFFLSLKAVYIEDIQRSFIFIEIQNCKNKPNLLPASYKEIVNLMQRQYLATTLQEHEELMRSHLKTKNN